MCHLLHHLLQWNRSLRTKASLPLKPQQWWCFSSTPVCSSSLILDAFQCLCWYKGAKLGPWVPIPASKRLFVVTFFFLVHNFPKPTQDQSDRWGWHNCYSQSSRRSGVSPPLQAWSCCDTKDSGWSLYRRWGLKEKHETFQLPVPKHCRENDGKHF